MIYTLKSTYLSPVPEDIEELEEGFRQGVHFTFSPDDLKFMLTTVERWFKKRDDVILVGHGTTSKQELAYIMLEWDEHFIDPVFLDILLEEERIHDVTIYTHDMEE
jgi:cobalamin biosynthesis Co2+ chelatase CbiK